MVQDPARPSPARLWREPRGPPALRLRRWWGERSPWQRRGGGRALGRGLQSASGEWDARSAVPRQGEQVAPSPARDPRLGTRPRAGLQVAAPEPGLFPRSAPQPHGFCRGDGAGLGLAAGCELTAWSYSFRHLCAVLLVKKVACELCIAAQLKTVCRIQPLCDKHWHPERRL